MDKTRLGAAAAISALIALPAAGAAAAPQPAVARAQSFAELLDPIPNAGERLKQADAEESAATPRLIPAQYSVHHHHHHAHAYVAPSRHHHHHYYYRRWRRPQRHHHHHQQPYDHHHHY